MTRTLRRLAWRVRRAWERLRLALDVLRHQGPGALLRRVRRSVAERRSARPRTEPVAATAAAPRRRRFDVIYVVGYPHGEPKRYRVANPAAALAARGYGVLILPFERLGEIERQDWSATALVLFRAEWEPLSGMPALLAHARRHGMRIVYDIDDLVFDPAIADRIDELRLMSAYLGRRYRQAMEDRRRLLLEADLVTVPTAALARAAAALGKPAAVIPNGLNRTQLDLAAAIAAAPKAPNPAPVIGYFSGSRTHQRDFAECAGALQAILRRHPAVRLRIVGLLDLDAGWAAFADRVERVGLLPPDAMLRSLAAIDINLAPLEIGNPFCEAKSELKFFEAALMGVPTIASATETFRMAIEDGVTGFTVTDEAGWNRALETLVTDPAARRAMGRAARESALARYGVEPSADRAIEVLGLGQPPGPAPNAAQPAATLRQQAS